MKLLILASFAILTQQLLSQDTTSSQIDLNGKYALQFQIAENFKLSSFNGTVISGKYCFNNTLAIRLGISYSSRHEDVDQTQSNLSTSSSNKINNKLSDYTIDFKPQVLFSNLVVEDISFYWGGGILLSYYYNSQDEKGTPDSILSDYKSTNSGFGFGLEAVAGVEWFVKSNISLSAEYGLQFNHVSTDSEQESKSQNVHHTSKWDYSYTRVGGSYVRLGLSVYF